MICRIHDGQIAAPANPESDYGAFRSEDPGRDWKGDGWARRCQVRSSCVRRFSLPCFDRWSLDGLFSAKQILAFFLCAPVRILLAFQ